MTETPDGPQSRLGALWAAVRKSPDRPASADNLVRDMYGLSPRGGPNTKAAAQDLGVSQRTVQRWIKDGMPKGRSRSGGPEQLKADHQAWKNSSAGRRAALSPRREARLRNQGTSMVFFGKISISGDQRRRSTTVDITGTQMGQIIDANLAADDVAAHAALEDAFGNAFGGSVSLEIDRLDTYR